MAKRDAQITVRIPAELKARLEELAKAEDRSLAYVVERILRAHFESAVAHPGERKSPANRRERG
jgi:predicted DNA-binding protein